MVGFEPFLVWGRAAPSRAREGMADAANCIHDSGQ